MKKAIIISVLGFLLLNCGQNNSEKKQRVNYKPEQLFLTFNRVGQEYIEYDIDSISSFQTLLDIDEEIDCFKYNALFKLETDKTIYKIQPLRFCEVPRNYTLKETIYINTVSIIVNDTLKYPIDSLKLVLNNHLLNPNKNENYPSSEEKRLISINVDETKKISETKDLLLKIITDINELNVENSFAFVFEKKGIIQVIEEKSITY